MRDGYDGATVRELANDAGVNHALIARYFGSKEELFAEVLACSPDAHDLFQGDTATFGSRLAKILVYEPPDKAALDALLIILRSAGSTAAAAMIREPAGSASMDRSPPDWAARMRMYAPAMWGPSS